MLQTKYLSFHHSLEATESSLLHVCLIINILYENVLLLQLLHTCDNVQDATGHIGDTKQINYITTSPCHLHPTCEDLDKKYTRNRTNIIHL